MCDVTEMVPLLPRLEDRGSKPVCCRNVKKIMTPKNLIALFEFILITVKVSNFLVLGSKIGLLPERNKTDKVK